VSPAFEAFLARLYVDEEARAAFLRDPREAARDLAPEEIAALEAIDRVGMELAADSFAQKRATRRRSDSGWIAAIRRWSRGLG
jgi:hypothetical protein